MYIVNKESTPRNRSRKQVKHIKKSEQQCEQFVLGSSSMKPNWKSLYASWGEGGCHKQGWQRKPQDSTELSVNGCAIAPAAVVMGKPYGAALPDHAIFETLEKFICTHLYLNVDKKFK